MGEQSDKPSVFSVETGILKTNKELDEIDVDEFVAAMKSLVKSGAAAPAVDITNTSFLPSYHVNGIREVGEEAVRNGARLTVFAKSNVTKLLERMGLGASVRLKSVD